VLGIVGAKAVRADHFGQLVGFVRGSGIAAATHFAQPDVDSRFGELPSGFGAGEAAADDLYLKGHWCANSPVPEEE